MKTSKYYLDRAEYMKRLAREAQTQSMRDGCLEAVKTYLTLAKRVERGEIVDDDRH